MLPPEDAQVSIREFVKMVAELPTYRARFRAFWDYFRGRKGTRKEKTRDGLYIAKYLFAKPPKPRKHRP